MYLQEEGKIWLATGSERVYLEPSMCNRHGLIAGATGTGKTVTLKVIAESFSDMGVPVFLADIKGDLTGMCVPGVENKHIRRSIDTMHIENFDYTTYPARFFDVYGKRDTRFEQRFPIWDRNCSAGCSVLTILRAAFCASCSRLPMTGAFCFWI